MFLGIPMPEQLRAHLSAIVSDLQENGIDAGNWSRPDLYHVTLVFLGEIDAKEQETVRLIAEEMAAACKAESLTVNALGAFPKSRILWAGIDTEEEKAWGALAQHLADRIRVETGLLLDKRPFRAHITLARKLNGQMTALQHVERLQAKGLLPLPKVDVDEFALFSSRRIDGQLAYPVEQSFRLVGTTPCEADNDE